MKSWNSLLFLLFFTAFIYSGCGKSDNSTNPDNQSSFKGSDFQPLVASPASIATFTVAITYFDSLGTVTSNEAAQGPMDPKHFIPDQKELNKLLPDEFKIGQEWFILGETSITVKAKELLGEYTSTTSKNYKDVLRLEVTSNTSKGEENVYSTVQTYLFNVYLVKGLGIVDVRVENYVQDHTSWDWDYHSNKFKKHFYRKVVSGTIGL